MKLPSLPAPTMRRSAGVLRDILGCSGEVDGVMDFTKEDEGENERGRRKQSEGIGGWSQVCREDEDEQRD